MEKRQARFLAVIVTVVFMFILSAVAALRIIHSVLSNQTFYYFWLFITVVGQGPFIIIPLDRGKTMRFIMDHLPQWILQLVVSVPVTNVLMLPLCLFLTLMPQPDKLYDILPFVLLAAVNLLMFNSASRIIQRRFVIPLEGLPENWKPLSILHLSDIHAGPFMRPGRLEEVVAMLNEKVVFDICLITGDIVNHQSQDLLWALPALEKLKCDMGTFACLGNHEYIDDEKNILRIFKRSSIRLLRDESVIVADKNHRIHLIGVDFPFEKEQANSIAVGKAIDNIVSLSESPSEEPAKSLKGDLKMLMSHHPDTFTTARRLGIPLTFSGHTHGGQIIVMGVNIGGRLYKYKRGIYRRKDKFLYVNSGLGNWMPFRINCPCEYAVITVIRKEDDTDARA